MDVIVSPTFAYVTPGVRRGASHELELTEAYPTGSTFTLPHELSIFPPSRVA